MNQLGGGMAVAKPSVEWGIVDYSNASGHANASAAGVATVTLGPPDPYYWLIDRIGITGLSVLRPIFQIYTGPASPENVQDISYLGNSDIADETSPIVLRLATVLTCQWTGCTPGALMTVNVAYRVAQRINH